MASPSSGCVQEEMPDRFAQPVGRSGRTVATLHPPGRGLQPWRGAPYDGHQLVVGARYQTPSRSGETMCTSRLIRCFLMSRRPGHLTRITLSSSCLRAMMSVSTSPPVLMVDAKFGPSDFSASLSPRCRTGLSPGFHRSLPGGSCLPSTPLRIPASAPPPGLPHPNRTARISP